MRRYFLEGKVYKAGMVENPLETLVELPEGSKLTITDGLPLSAYFTCLTVERYNGGWNVKYEKIRKRGGEVIDMDRCWGRFIEKQEELKALVEKLELKKTRGSFELEFCFFARDKRFSKLKRIITYEPLKVEHAELELQIEDFKEGRVYSYRFEAPRECMCFVDDVIDVYLNKLDFELVHEILKITVA